MKRQPPYLKFGQALRRYRQSRGLTLKEVSQCSVQAAPDKAGLISQPYLSQLESGHRARISIPKLLVLAAVLGVPVKRLIESCPPDMRRELGDSVAQWRGPKPNPGYRPSPLVQSAMIALDASIREKASGVAVPIGREERFTYFARVAVPVEALPAFIRMRGRGIVDRFWRDRHEVVDDIVVEERGHDRWYRVVAEFQDWLTLDLKQAPELLGVIRSWWCDEDTFAGSVHFVDADTDAEYGFDGAPLFLACGIRWRQAANVMVSVAPDTCPLLWAPPRPIGAVREFLVRMIHPTFPMVEDGPLPDLHVTMAQICDYAARVRELRPDVRIEDDVHEATVRLLNEAGEWSAVAPAAAKDETAHPG